ncbi:MAG: YggU family protein [Anaerolineae bacterium CG_4_9_14_0_8_um_filter_58_9]|nr:MAG: YggU family protein [Anaerolineae bacterium CG06_land_8_20_14_3_00_57_67]PJH75051.1 MAG: YggU family protein [Anaerolineae bacterium CG_4_9_14_0_8_um_filter_58_9]
MERRKYELHDGKRGAALAVRVTPRASRNEIFGVLNDGTVKIHLTAPPVEGQANEALLKFLSEVLGVPVSRLDIVAGKTGRDKLVSIMGVDAETVHKRIIRRMS